MLMINAKGEGTNTDLETGVRWAYVIITSITLRRGRTSRTHEVLGHAWLGPSYAIRSFSFWSGSAKIIAEKGRKIFKEQTRRMEPAHQTPLANLQPLQNTREW